ncbi:MAG: hypothetical protein JW699_01115 [Chitinispirillaceae bacterium]|nr:hypothetical protein [Chitinispirillaceae bacterium]
MADTPLELYEQAYRLQYHDKKTPEAVKIYETIIRDFPDSNECGYAFIQLQKVKANDISKMLRKGPASVYPMIIVAFLTSLLALTVAVIGAVFLFQQLRQEHHRSTLAMIALGKICGGNDAFALKIIDEMKASSPGDVLTSELTSDITARKRAAARPVLRTFADSAAQKAAQESPAALKPAPAMPSPARTKTSTPVRKGTKPLRNPIIYGSDSISYF